jgi:hypothetical protein
LNLAKVRGRCSEQRVSVLNGQTDVIMTLTTLFSRLNIFQILSRRV